MNSSRQAPEDGSPSESLVSDTTAAAPWKIRDSDTYFLLHRYNWCCGAFALLLMFIFAMNANTPKGLNTGQLVLAIIFLLCSVCCWYSTGTHYVRIREKKVQIGRDYMAIMCSPSGIGNYGSAEDAPMCCETGLCLHTQKEYELNTVSKVKTLGCSEVCGCPSIPFLDPAIPVLEHTLPGTSATDVESGAGPSKTRTELTYLNPMPCGFVDQCMMSATKKCLPVDFHTNDNIRGINEAILKEKAKEKVGNVKDSVTGALGKVKSMFKF